LLDSLNIKKINLNQASYKELISHPYITKSASYAILQYREFSDSIEHIDELFLNQIIDRDCFSRVAPYLSVH
jgi:DNA uptake protein ComE-like DNA-binding protein